MLALPRPQIHPCDESPTRHQCRVQSVDTHEGNKHAEYRETTCGEPRIEETPVRLSSNHGDRRVLRHKLKAT